MLALFLYDSFLLARHITREGEYQQVDSILLILDAGYRGSLSYFFFGKFFDYDIPEVLSRVVQEEDIEDWQMEEQSENARAGEAESLEDAESADWIDIWKQASTK